MSRRHSSSRRWRRMALLPALAAGMLATVLIPASVWASPKVDATQRGFNPSLMYSDAAGGGTAAGDIAFADNALDISAIPGSSPTVDLVTSPLSYEVSFSVLVRNADAGTRPLTIAVTSPYDDYESQLVFTDSPTTQVQLQRTHKGVVLQQTVLGVYSPGQLYQVDVNVDRTHSVASITLSTPTGEVLGGDALDVQATGSAFESHILTTDVVPVTPGQSYSFGSIVKPLSAGLVGLTIDWLDVNQGRLSVESDWQPAGASGTWAGRSLAATAPPDAKYARVELSTANGAEALFSQATFHAAGTAHPENLLSNGLFLNGAAGWRRAEGTEPLDVRQFSQRTYSSTFTATTWPDLFESLRMAVVVSAESDVGLASTTLADYKVVLPHERWLADRVSDWRLTTLTSVLGALGLFALV